MARRAQPLIPAIDGRLRLGGGAALALIAALTLGSATATAWLGLDSGRVLRLTDADWRALVFTARQAFLSALLSLVIAIPLARALARRRFRGRALLIAVLGAPFLLPVIVAILGVIIVWGRAGWISDCLAAVGLARLDVYGLPGVLLAHVFFNLPLATRLLLQGFAAIPAESWRLAAQLDASPRAVFRLLEWPAIRSTAPGAFALVFLLCLTSFAVALTLGGGPRATTLELGIYEAVAYDFDLGRAVALALLQIAVGLGGALLALRLAAPVFAAPGLSLSARRWDGGGAAARMTDAAVILVAILFLGAPILAVALRGVIGIADLPASVWSAAARSFSVALLATALALALGAPLAVLSASLARRGGGRMAQIIDLIGLTPLVASPFVIGVALIVLLRPIANPAAVALFLTALSNAVMATPFVLRILQPALAQAAADRGRLADSLDLRGLTRFRALYWPAARAPLGFAAGLTAALSMGDLGVIALFSAPDAPTLPLLMQRLAAHRQLDAASGAALLLALSSFLLFWIFDRVGRR